MEETEGEREEKVISFSVSIANVRDAIKKRVNDEKEEEEEEEEEEKEEEKEEEEEEEPNAEQFYDLCSTFSLLSFLFQTLSIAVLETWSSLVLLLQPLQ